MAIAETERLNIYYEQSFSDNERVLFIGGVCGDLRNKPNVFDSVLNDHFDLMAFDQRGTGRSEKPDVEYSLLDYVEDTIALLDHCGWHKTHVVGVSFGGMVAQELAIRYPERVKGLVLCCTTPGGEGGSSYPLHELIGVNSDVRSRKMLAIGDSRRNEAWQMENPKQTAKLLRLSAASASPFLSEPGGLESYNRQIMARSQHNAYERLNKIKARTLVCAGKYDDQAKLEVIRNLCDEISGSTLKVFEGGHAFLAQDRKAYLEIKDFLLNC